MQRHLIGITWLLLVVVSGMCFVVTPVFAQTYKWKDADGKVHYSDQPPPANAKEPMTVKPGKPSATAPASTAAPTAKGGVAAAKPKSYTEQEADFKKRQVEAAERDAADKKKAAEAAEKQKNCEQARAQLKGLESGGRMTRNNAQGEREYLNDAQIAQEIERTKKTVANWCN
ncbi:MAG TPA: DUF4124 domain-containing protein [Burkholderiales bacterium]|nr:DUF4124 domain-containing protein [Burkholderiales bacterium]